MPAATLVYPHQLFSSSPALSKDRRVYLIEDPLLFGTDRRWPLQAHQQRLCMHRASMRAYRKELDGRGYDVVYVDLPQGGNSDSVTVLDSALPKDIDRIDVCDVHDDVLGRRLRRFAKRRGAKLIIHDTPNFLTPPEFLEQFTGADVRKPFMATFYKAQRQRLGILVDKQGNPAGGQWSFDADNREKLPKDHPVPDAPRARRNHYVDEAMAWTADRFGGNPGSLDCFAWPVTRAAAKSWLEEFLDERFKEFGPYEDALSRHRVMFHSVLTPAMNIGLLTPQAVVDAALDCADGRKIPLNSLEGFIRQVIGWREFMWGIYRFRGGEIRNGNFWNFDRKMPACFYNANTGIAPVDDSIRHARDHGWAHHIERLMVLGNFMLLCRIDPSEVYRWFMELFVDAYDWVMVPNVYGMSQFADGGTFTTKPYLSGSNYIRKMSHYAKGDWCDVWDGLYWTFIADHQDFFAGNHRLSMMARGWDNMKVEKKQAHRLSAQAFLEQR